MADDEGERMIAWKFTRAGAVGPFSGVAWPPAGTWLEVQGRTIVPCRRAVHASTVDDLPLWLSDELWCVELRDPVVRSYGKLAAPAGRLLERVDEWHAETAAEYADACVERATASAAVLTGETGAIAAGLVADAIRCAERARREAAVAPTLASGSALCAARLAGLASAAGIGTERAWQTRWLAQRLALA
jgi:hypothetical protein